MLEKNMKRTGKLTQFNAKKFVFVVGFFAVVMLIARPSVEWGYEEINGPDLWAELDETYHPCGEGLNQSPIDIQEDDGEDSDLLPLRFAYEDDVTITLVHNGHTIKAVVPVGGGDFHIGDDVFHLKQFHFHTPSEHLVDGKEFPMEMHLVHQGDDGTLAVVGIFIAADDDPHNELNKIFSVLPQSEGSIVSIQDFDISNMGSPSMDTYRYSGSLTTPPCSEGVRWTVMADPIELSDDQIEAFTSLFSGNHFPDGNRRPVQLLNDRILQSSDD